MTLTKTPQVSVVIPAYNAAEFIGEALDSVLAQTVKASEIIVINDGSPDTPALLTALEPYRERITYIEQENQGPGGARNTGVLRARTEYVAFLDSDDSWEPHFLATQLPALERPEGRCDVVYADALLVGDSPLAGRTFMDGAPSNGPVTLESLLRLDCVVFTSCVVARRSTLIEAGLFDPQFFHSEDFELWLRVVRTGGAIGYHRAVVAKHRAHPASLTAQPGALLRSQVRICDKLAADPGLGHSALALVAEHRAWCEAQLSLAEGKQKFIAGEYAEARIHLRDALRVIRTLKLRVAVIALRLAPSVLHWLYRLRHRRYLRSEIVRSSQ